MSGDPAARLLRYFEYDHLPGELRVVAERFALTARWAAENLPPGPELTTALRKLLEAKDCAVRAALPES